MLKQFQLMAVLNSATELSLQTDDANRLLTDMLHTVSKQAHEKQITISTALESGIVSIHCDPDMLHRALVELLENAIQFTPRGRQIHVRSEIVNHHELMIEVEDNGIGIAPDQLPHIFKHFFKADESRPMTGGAGLGLAMVKRIIELHHGSIEVESTVGEKTIFRMMLPAVVSEAKTISK